MAGLSQSLADLITAAEAALTWLEINAKFDTGSVRAFMDLRDEIESAKKALPPTE